MIPKRERVLELLAKAPGTEVLAKGWVRTKRGNKNITFIAKITIPYGGAEKSNDIYLVAEVLGHKDVNTTKKHYAAMSEDLIKQASKIIRIKK